MSPERGRRATQPGRAAWGTTSRDQIVDAATELARRDEAVSIRGLARHLGLAPMSIYRHVDSLDDLLDEVADQLLGEIWPSGSDRTDWKAWIADVSDDLRRFLVARPAALQVYLRHPPSSPTTMKRMEAILAVLHAELGDEQHAHRAYAAIQTYTIGFAALEAARGIVEDVEEPLPGTHAAATPAERLARFTTPRQFAQGLRYLLDGIDGAPGRVAVSARC